MNTIYTKLLISGLVFAGGILASVNSFAGPTLPVAGQKRGPQSPALEIACNACGPINALTGKFQSLNFLNDQDKQSGLALMPKVREMWIRYADRLNRTPTAELAALSRLMIHAAPYDEEDELASFASAGKDESKPFSAAFDSQLNALPKSCLRREVETSVRAMTCLDSQRETGTYETGKKVPTCEQPGDSSFNFEDCLMLEKKGRKPSSDLAPEARTEAGVSICSTGNCIRGDRSLTPIDLF